VMSARHDAVELTRRTPGKLCGKPALMYLAGDPNALFTVREEGRRGGRCGEAKAARNSEESTLIRDRPVPTVDSADRRNTLSKAFCRCLEA
jgi:hypothetical protein